MNYTLDTLLAPLHQEAFLRDCWDTRPVFVRGGDPGKYAGLFSANDLEPLLSLTGLGPKDSYRVVKWEGDSSKFFESPEDTRPVIQYFYQAFTQGYTIVVDSIETRWGSIAALCMSLQTTLNHPIRAGLFFTPPRSQGFAAHYDSCGVFVLQLDGFKRWRLYEKPTGKSLPKNPPRCDIGEPTQELLLNPGDLLYIPTGCIHEAVTSESSSLHLSLGIEAFTWIDLLQEVWKAAAAGDSELTRPLPIGFLHSAGTELDAELQRLVARLDIPAARAEAVENLAKSLFKRGLPPAPDGHFASLERLETLALDTLVRRRSELSVQVRPCPKGTALDFETNSVAGPAFLLPAFQYIARTREFTPAQLPGSLSDRAKLNLVQRLVKEGLLSIPLAAAVANGAA